LIDRCLKFMTSHSTNEVSNDHGIGFFPLSMLCKKLMDRTEIVNKSIFLPFPNEGAAERMLERPQYEGDIEMVCEFHLEVFKKMEIANSDLRKSGFEPFGTEVVDSCSTAVVQRLIYNFLKYYRSSRNLPLDKPSFAPLIVDMPEMEVSELDLTYLDDGHAPRHSQNEDHHGLPRI